MLSHWYKHLVIEPLERGSAYNFGTWWMLSPLFGGITFTLMWLTGLWLMWKQQKDLKEAHEELSKY